MAHRIHAHVAARHAPRPSPTHGNIIHWARWYDPVVNFFTFGRRAALRAATVQLAHLHPGMAVLEVGCGTGDVALAAKRLTGPVGPVHGIDPAPEMIAVARGKAAASGLAADFQVGVIEALPFPDASFDVVFSSLMLHHLPEDLKQRGLAEVARVLKPGGRVVIVDLKRPTDRRSRALTALLMHGGMTSGVQDAPQLLAEVGFARVETGDLPLGYLGYVVGWV